MQMWSGLDNLLTFIDQVNLFGVHDFNNFILVLV